MTNPFKNRKLFLTGLLLVALTLFALDRYALSAYRPTADSKDVVLYSAVWCGYCAKLKRDLDASKIPYTEHDVETSLRGWAGFYALRGRGVPVTAIGPKVLYGYDVAGIAGALQEIGYTYLPASDETPLR